MGQRILIVEDEVKLAKTMVDYLTHNGKVCHHIDHGDEVLTWLNAHPADLILLDLMLPGKNGTELCQAIRQFSNIPIIMVTAKTDEIDELLGLELGADDYISKPFSLRTLLARVNSILRRASPQVIETQSTLSLNNADFSVSYADNKIKLTSVEFNLLQTLKNSPGRIFSRDNLVDKMYHDSRIISDRTVDSHIKKLRKKLVTLAPELKFIHSLYGVGYKYEEAI